MATLWIDSHCHVINPTPLNPPTNVLAHVVHCVLAATKAADFEFVRQSAHASGNSYALGIHPWFAEQACADDLDCLELALQQDDPRLVAVGEIGLDRVASSTVSRAWRDRQNDVYVKQLKLAQRYHLPVVLHSRGSVDQVLAGLRSAGHHPAWCGVAHAFNGSLQQANALIGLGFKLGFGGAFTHARALHQRRLVVALPLDAIVLETDAPDMPPRWLIRPTEQSAAGQNRGINTSEELPRIGQELATLRSMSVSGLAQATAHNAKTAFPKMTYLL